MKLIGGAFVRILLVGIGLSHFASATFSQDTRCSVSKLKEPSGQCVGTALPRVCYNPNFKVTRWCVAADIPCPRGARDLGISDPNNKDHYDVVTRKLLCEGKIAECPNFDIGHGREGNVCRAWTQLPPKGGSPYDVKSTDPPCRSTGDNRSACGWTCLSPPAGFKVDPTSVRFAAKEATTSCSDPGAYVAFDPKICGTPTTVGNCAPSWYTWEQQQVQSDQVCGRLKNWSHDRTRCGDITFSFGK